MWLRHLKSSIVRPILTSWETFQMQRGKLSEIGWSELFYQQIWPSINNQLINSNPLLLVPSISHKPKIRMWHSRFSSTWLTFQTQLSRGKSATNGQSCSIKNFLTRVTLKGGKVFPFLTSWTGKRWMWQRVSLGSMISLSNQPSQLLLWLLKTILDTSFLCRTLR
jgi:hypothetical protein